MKFLLFEDTESTVLELIDNLEKGLEIPEELEEIFKAEYIRRKAALIGFGIEDPKSLQKLQSKLEISREQANGLLHSAITLLDIKDQNPNEHNLFIFLANAPYNFAQSIRQTIQNGSFQSVIQLGCLGYQSYKQMQKIVGDIPLIVWDVNHSIGIAQKSFKQIDFCQPVVEIDSENTLFVGENIFSYLDSAIRERKEVLIENLVSFIKFNKENKVVIIEVEHKAINSVKRLLARYESLLEVKESTYPVLSASGFDVVVKDEKLVDILHAKQYYVLEISVKDLEEN